MVVKKNVGIKTVALLLLLLLNLFAFSTYSFASQPTLEEMTNFIDLIKVKQNNGELFSANKINGNSTSIATQFLNLTSDIDYTLENVVYLTGKLFRSNSSWISPCQGVLLIANNTFNENLPFLYIEYQPGSNPMLLTTTSNGSAWGTYYAIKNSDINKYTNCTQLHYDSGSYTWSPNSELTVLTNNVIFTKLKTVSIYVKYSGNFYPMLNNYNGQNYNEYYGISEEPDNPDEPSGDVGETTGTITNPSGEETGKIDLSGIENGIGDINENIDKTNEKLDGISGEIGNLNNSINDLNNFLSGDVSEEKTEEIERSFKY